MHYRKKVKKRKGHHPRPVVRAIDVLVCRVGNKRELPTCAVVNDSPLNTHASGDTHTSGSMRARRYLWPLLLTSALSTARMAEEE